MQQIIQILLQYELSVIYMELMCNIMELMCNSMELMSNSRGICVLLHFMVLK